MFLCRHLSVPPNLNPSSYILLSSLASKALEGRFFPIFHLFNFWTPSFKTIVFIWSHFFFFPTGQSSALPLNLFPARTAWAGVTQESGRWNSHLYVTKSLLLCPQHPFFLTWDLLNSSQPLMRNHLSPCLTLYLCTLFLLRPGLWNWPTVPSPQFFNNSLNFSPSFQWACCPPQPRVLWTVNSHILYFFISPTLTNMVQGQSPGDPVQDHFSFWPLIHYLCNPHASDMLFYEALSSTCPSRSVIFLEIWGVGERHRFQSHMSLYPSRGSDCLFPLSHWIPLCWFPVYKGNMNNPEPCGGGGFCDSHYHAFFFPLWCCIS